MQLLLLVMLIITLTACQQGDGPAPERSNVNHSTIAGKDVDGSKLPEHKEVLIYDQHLGKWVTARPKLEDIDGRLDAARLDGKLELDRVQNLAQILDEKAGKAAIDESLSNKLDKSGGKMTGALQLFDQDTGLESQEQLKFVDRAKMWFNTTLSKIKFWTGSESKTVATTDEVETKANALEVNRRLDFKVETSLFEWNNLQTVSAIDKKLDENRFNQLVLSLGQLSKKDQVTENDISGKIDGDKISGSINPSVLSEVPSSKLTGFINGKDKAADFISLLVSGTPVMTTNSTISSDKINDGVTTAGAGGRVVKTRADGKIDHSLIPEGGWKQVTSDSIDNSSGRFLENGTNASTRTVQVGLGSESFFKVNPVDAFGPAVGVGLGQDSPSVALEVKGTVVSRSFDNSTSIDFDWNKANVIYSSYQPTADKRLNFTNIQDGGAYTLVMKNTTSVVFTFGTDQGLTFRFNPANGPTMPGKHTIYNFIRVGTTVYVSWAPGF